MPKQTGLGDELFATPMGSAENVAGPHKGDFIPPPDVPDMDEPADALPEQEEFWRPPARFGSIPVEKEPLGWDRRRGFRKHFPQVMLPTQVVERVSFGHPQLDPNRLFWGDNLHVMRQLPSESIDLIYIDPPFFSGKQYNVIFGDKNELRSFSDIWEAGMPGYLVWLNARLFEMKRLLKPAGAIYVHLDWHASHYVKIEMDKVFGHECFKNEIVWKRTTTKSDFHQGATNWARIHDVLLYYARNSRARTRFQQQFTDYPDDYVATKYRHRDPDGRRYMLDKLTAPGSGSRGHPQYELMGVIRHWVYGKDKMQELVASGRVVQPSPGTVPRYKRYLDEVQGVAIGDTWSDINAINSMATERLGYPTQKPEALLERIIETNSDPGGRVADFFAGGGTTAAVAQRLGRRWVACDQSRVAVAITADRLANTAEQPPLNDTVFPVPDFTVEHWGIYEAKRLSETPQDQFSDFVLRAYGAVPQSTQQGFQGNKGAVPVWVGGSSQRSQVTAQDVQDFANAVRKTVRYQQDSLRDGIMLAWAFRPDAVEAADKLRELEQTDLNFVRLDLLRIDDPRFREHVAVLTTDKADYSTFLTFVQPPHVEVGHRRVKDRSFKFDVSDTAVLNAGAKIINVQWDFDYGERFSSTQGYSFVRTNRKEPVLIVNYTFPRGGKHRIACKVQDDAGGEGLWTGEIEV